MTLSIADEAKALKDKLSNDEKNPLKVALFGQPGSGKSSIINKLVGAEVAKTGPKTDVTQQADIVQMFHLG
ncbi:MAG: 50S ribosome-binding GTPase [Deltaproteobacteria bacterium]|nr:50S ribosome-binding GTPase [Deltaproteobacteria bacterium]